MCKCVLYYCHRVATQLQLTTVSYLIECFSISLHSFNLLTEISATAMLVGIQCNTHHNTIRCIIFNLLSFLVFSCCCIPMGSIFLTRPDRPWDPPSLLYSGYRVSFLAVKRLWRAVDHLPASSAEVKERVDLYLYSHSGLTWSVLE